jgi:hypothetical protein
MGPWPLKGRVHVVLPGQEAQWLAPAAADDGYVLPGPSPLVDADQSWAGRDAYHVWAVLGGEDAGEIGKHSKLWPGSDWVVH